MEAKMLSSISETNFKDWKSFKIKDIEDAIRAPDTLIFYVGFRGKKKHVCLMLPLTTFFSVFVIA